MNVRQIIEKHLTKEGADGLILPYVISGCEGCHGKDLMVCQTYPWRIEDCVPAILKDGKLVPMPEKGREVKHTNNCASCPRQNCNEVYHRDGSCRPDSFGKMTKEAKEKPYVPFMNRLSKKDKAIFRAGMAKLRKRFNQKHPNKYEIKRLT